MVADPNTLTMHQGTTFRVVFKMTDTSGTASHLTGLGARFTIFDRPGGTVLLAVTDTMTGDTLTAGNTDVPLAVEPGGAIGEIHLRLGADQTSLITRPAAYDAVLYSLTDPTEVQPLVAGALAVVLAGANA